MASDSDPIPILTPGVEPTSGGSHSPPSSFFSGEPVWGDKGKEYWDGTRNETEDANKLAEKAEHSKDGGIPKSEGRKRVVVVGLGMVGVSFM